MPTSAWRSSPIASNLRRPGARSAAGLHVARTSTLGEGGPSDRQGGPASPMVESSGGHVSPCLSPESTESRNPSVSLTCTTAPSGHPRKQSERPEFDAPQSQASRRDGSGCGTRVRSEAPVSPCNLGIGEGRYSNDRSGCFLLRSHSSF